MNDKISIYDHSTGETIVREMTDEEQAQRNAEVADHLSQEANKIEEAKEAKAKREALLARLGITEEEASLLAQSL